MARKKKRKRKTVYKRMNNKAYNKPFKLEEILQQKIVKQYLGAYIAGYILNVFGYMRGETLTSPFHSGVIMGFVTFKSFVDLYNHPKWSKMDAMGHAWKTMAQVFAVWIFYIALAFLFDLFGLDIRSFLGLAAKRSY